MTPRLAFALRAASLSALAGALLFLACAHFDIWPLAWFGLVPLLHVLEDERCRAPFVYGWVCGLLANGGGFYWINGLLQRFGHMPFVASAPIFLLLVAYQALEFGAFALILRWLRRHTRLPLALLAPVTMTALELVTPFIFPWYLAITQAWVRPVIQIADLTGPLGVSFLLVMSSGALYDVLGPLLRRDRARGRASLRPLAIAAATVALALAYGQVRIRQVEAMRAAAPKIEVGVVQANIGIQEKWDPRRAAENLELHQSLSRDLARRGADLIVWPESSYPFPIDRDRREDFGERRAGRVRRGFDTPLVFGALTVDRSGEESPYPFNSALILDQAGRFTGRFDKNFLLVFGEYIPFYERLKWVQRLIPEAGNLARGEGVTVFPLEVPRLGDRAHVRLGPMICYEDIIPTFARRLVEQRPNLLVNITNDAWFGATSEPWEHFALAVYRAVEHRLDLVRAVNTGVSAYVDATGKVYDESPAVDPDAPEERGPPGARRPPIAPVAMLDEVAILDASGLYGRVGDLFGVLCLAALCGLAAVAARRMGRPLHPRAVALGAGVLLASVTLVALVASPGAPALGLSLLAHRSLPSSDATFSAGLVLSLASAVLCVATGFLLRRTIPDKPLGAEAAIAAALFALAPAFLFGRIEGETTSLVFALIFAALLLRLGLRLGRKTKRPAPER